jgi:hypothetical protein
MPLMPASIIEPIRDQFLAPLPAHEDPHLLGCPNPRLPDASVFETLIQALVFGRGHERIADAPCPATTLRRRRDEWITAGVADHLHRAAPAAYHRMIGLDRGPLVAQGGITKAPGAGECAGKSPLERAEQGLKGFGLSEGAGIPLITDPGPADVCDHILLPVPLDRLPALEKIVGPLPEHPRLSLDAGYGDRGVYAELSPGGISAPSAPRGGLTPVQAEGRWVVGRTNSWLNNFGGVRRCTARHRDRVAFFLALASALITVRSLIRRA